MKRITLLAGFVALALCSRAAGDTVGVYFPFNESEPSAASLTALDSALNFGALHQPGTFLIYGHTDALGGEGYNLQLSRKRAIRVKALLIGSGIAANEIRLLDGLGEQNALPAIDPDSRPQDRRVDVILVHRKPETASIPVAVPVPVTGRAPLEPGRRRDSANSLNELQPGESLVLQNVYFFPGKHFVRPESYAALDALLRILLEHPSMQIRIEGHVCCVGLAPDAIDDDTHRIELSVNRAHAIRSMLIEQGIAPERLEAVGFGHRFPIVMDERSEDDANRNRRVEIRILAR